MLFEINLIVPSDTVYALEGGPQNGTRNGISYKLCKG